MSISQQDLNCSSSDCVVDSEAIQHGQIHGSMEKPSAPLSYSDDKSMCLDLIIQCLSGLDNVSKATKFISFNRTNANDAQIKQLEFMLGELKIDMQILFERNCSTPDVATVSSMTLNRATEVSAQTDEIMAHSYSHIEQASQLQRHDSDIIHKNEQYQAEILQLRQENDELKCTNNDQKQTIWNLRVEIAQKNQLLMAAKALIDDDNDETTKENQVTDASKNCGQNHHSYSTFNCQQCTITSDALVQSVAEKDGLSAKNHQLTRMVLSCEKEIQTLDRKLQQSTEKYVQFKNKYERSMDAVHHLQSYLESQQSKETDQFRKKESQTPYKHSNDLINNIASKANGSVDALLSRDKIEFRDDKLTQNDENITLNESTSHLGLNANTSISVNDDVMKTGSKIHSNEGVIQNKTVYLKRYT